MPTVLRIKGYRFFFSRHCSEPTHVHVARSDDYAKFWLEPVCLAHNSGFRSNELAEIRRLIEEHDSLLLKRWNEHFRSQG